MTKKAVANKSEVKNFLKDANTLFAIATPQKYPKLVVAELPFDLQLLNSSHVYRESRKQYLALGGKSFLSGQ